MIHLEGINKTYFNGAPLHVLKGIDLDIEKGEMVSIMGASGSGKSTLLNILGILDTYDTGIYTLNGQLIRNLSETRAAELRNRMIGFIFQSFNLISFKNAMENVALPLYYQGVSRKKRNAMALEYLDMVGLKDWAEHMPNEMSGGQKQRVAIARALVKMPKVLLLDEPLSNLDARLRLQTREELRRIQCETKITTVFVTHDQEEAMSISDMIIVMKEGVIQQIGKPQEVYDNPANLFVAKFLGTPPINVFRGQVKDHTLYIGKDAILKAGNVPDQEVWVGVRPEGFILNENGALHCNLSRIEVMGRDVSVVSTKEESENATIRSIISAENSVDTGSLVVSFDLKPNKVFLFHKDTQERIPYTGS